MNTENKPLKICPQCHKKFRSASRRFCSDTCMAQSKLRKKNGHLFTIECAYCSKTFTSETRVKYCSDQCGKVSYRINYLAKEAKRLTPKIIRHDKGFDVSVNTRLINPQYEEYLKNRAIAIKKSPRITNKNLIQLDARTWVVSRVNFNNDNEKELIKQKIIKKIGKNYDFGY